MPWFAVAAIGASIAGAAIGGYYAEQGAETQAGAAERAASLQAATSQQVARINAKAAEKQAAMQLFGVRYSIASSQHDNKIRMTEAFRIAMKDSLRNAISIATQDTMFKVGEFVKAGFSNFNRAEYVRLLAKDGHDDAFVPPPELDAYSMSTTDLLTGEQLDNPQYISGGEHNGPQPDYNINGIPRDLDALNNEVDRLVGDAEGLIPEEETT